MQISKTAKEVAGMSFLKNETIPQSYLFSKQDIMALMIPLILEQLLVITVGMLDSIMVSYAGESAVSGVSLVDSIMILIQQLFAALAAGGAVVAGQYLGMQKEEKACRSVNQLLIFCFLAGIVVTAVLYAIRGFLLSRVFGAITPEVHSAADVYLLITSASVPFLACFLAAFAVFRAQGDSKLSLRVSVVINLINLTGNAILVYGFKMGTAGVAIPTLISRMAGAFLSCRYLMKQERTLHIHLPFHFVVERKMLYNILYIGVPNGFESFMFNFGKIILLSLVAEFGTASIAANAIGNSLGLYQVLPGLAISFGVVTVVSRCIGANDINQARFYTKYLLKMSRNYCGIATIAIFALCVPVLKIYNVSPEAEKFAFTIVIIHGLGIFFTYAPSFVLPSALRAANDVRYCLIISSITMWICRVGGSFILARWCGLGVIGVWAAMQFDWLGRTVCYIHRFKGDKWHTARLS